METESMVAQGTLYTISAASVAGKTPPAISTIHATLDRHGLVKRRKRHQHKAEGTELSDAR